MISIRRNADMIKILNMMKMSENLLCDYEVARKLANCSKARNRSKVIDWIKKTLGTDFSDERDTSIQIFDKVLLISFMEDENKLDDNYFMYHIAAASIIISCKLHDIRTDISPSMFVAQFSTDELVNYEREILATTRCSISPLCTPSSFARHILHLHPVGYDTDSLLRSVDTLISEFWEEPDSILFAPSTIAISALLISFSMLQIYCTTWLDSIPDFCLPNAINPVFQVGTLKVNYLDLDKCITTFEQIPSLKEQQDSTSPTSVSEAYYLENNVGKL